VLGSLKDSRGASHHGTHALTFAGSRRPTAAREPGGIDPVLAIEAVSKAFPGTQALRGASLTVERGTVHGLVGSNGSGKSTLLKILAGVYEADEGSLEVGGATWDLKKWTPSLARAHRLHFVHQQPTTFGALTVGENLAIGRGFETDALRRVRWRATRRRASAVLDRFEIKARPTDRVADLAPAAQTMVEIARALQDQEGESDGVLVLDEPTAALPKREVDLVLRRLRRYAGEGQAILFVSHRLDEVLDVADVVTVLRDGRVICTTPRAQLTRDELVRLIVGHDVDDDWSEPAVNEHAATLEVSNVSGGAVRSASLRVSGGEILGLAGLAGSGRSSLLRLLFGAEPLQTGSIRLDGEVLRLRRPRDAIEAGIGFVPEDRLRDAILPGLSVAENLTITNIAPYWRRGRLRRRAERLTAKEVIATFGVRALSGDVGITTLSGGNQQKLMLARWLRQAPRVLLLDEPTQGVDVGATADLWALIRQAADAGAAVIVASSDFEELTRLCERLIVLRDGRVVGELDSTQMNPERINQVLHRMDAAA
jgi:ribose transport system ATP-binding protein